MFRIIAALAIFFVTPASAVNLNAECKSSSGMSSYSIAINAGRGSIRYQFMGQDVLYRIMELRQSNGNIFGKADFEFAYSGETKGKPINFSYNFAKQEFNELNLVAKCEVK